MTTLNVLPNERWMWKYRFPADNTSGKKRVTVELNISNIGATQLVIHKWPPEDINGLLSVVSGYRFSKVR